MPEINGTARPDRPGLGAALIVFAVFMMATQDAIIKFASSDLTLWQIYVLRSAIALPLLAAPALVLGHGMPILRAAFGGWALLRGLLLAAMYVSLYAAITLLPLATLAAGFYTGPLFIALLSAVVIGEPVSRRGWAAVAAGFCGVLLILQPGGEGFTPAVFLAVLSGFLYALAAIVTRARCGGVSPTTLAVSLTIVLFATGATASGVLLLPVFDGIDLQPFLFGRWAPLGWHEAALIAALALLIVGIGIALAAAYQVAPPVVVATFDYSYLVFSTLYGFLLFAERPDGPTIAGMATIALAGLAAARFRGPVRTPAPGAADGTGR